MENTTDKLNRCRICSAVELIHQFDKDGYEVVRCEACRLVFLNFAPSREFLNDYYSEDFFHDPGKKHGFRDYETEAENLGKSFSDRIKIIRKYQDGGRLLDVGCATGTFLEAASKYWQAEGVEISSYASKIAQNKNLNVYNGELQNSPYVKNQYQVATLWDTLEHLVDPQETVNLLSKMLVPGGIIALTTGDVGSRAAKISGRYWHLYNIPQHLSFFDRKTITRLLKNGDFEVSAISYPSLNFSLDYLLFRLLTFYRIKPLLPLYQTLSSRSLVNFSLKINLYDVMLVIAKKVTV